MTIKNKKFRKAMEEAGLGAIQLEKGNGYFWIWSDSDSRPINLKNDSILVYSFNHQSIEEWVKTIKEMLVEGCDS